MPNSRQMALIIWAALLLVYLLIRGPAVRKSTATVVRTMVGTRVLVPALLLVATVVALLYAASKFGLWDISRATDTAFWFGSAFALLLNMSRVTEGDRYIRRTIGELCGIALVLEVVLEVSVLSLPVEMILVPVITIVALMQVVANANPEHHAILGCLGWALGLIGVALATVSVYRVVTDFDRLDLDALGRQALLPIWATLGVLPFIYALGVYSKYEWINTIVDFRSGKSRKRRLLIKAAFVREYGFRASRLGAVDGTTVRIVARTNSWKESRRAIQQRKTR